MAISAITYQLQSSVKMFVPMEEGGGERGGEAGNRDLTKYM